MITLIIVCMCGVCCSLASILYASGVKQSYKEFIHYKSEYLKIFGRHDQMDAAYMNFLKSVLALITVISFGAFFFCIFINLLSIGTWKM